MMFTAPKARPGIRFILVFALAAITGIPSAAQPTETQPIKAVTEANNYADYVKFLAGRDPLQIRHFAGPSSRRSVVELILLQQALHRGGLRAKIDFVFSPNYLRMIHLVQAGDFVVSGNSVWQVDTKRFSDHVLVSQALIRHGEYEAGIYALASNKPALAAQNLQDIRQFKLVTNKHWQVDWATISQLKLHNIYNVPMWDTMVVMLIRGRVDYVLAPFSSNKDLSLTLQDHKLLPVPGLKVGLVGSRHFIVSSKHPKSDVVYRSLQEGLRLMRAEGKVRRALEEAGFINKQVQDWQKLN